MEKRKKYIFEREGYQITISKEGIHIISIDYHATSLDIDWETMQKWQELVKSL